MGYENKSGTGVVTDRPSGTSPEFPRFWRLYKALSAPSLSVELGYLKKDDYHHRLITANLEANKSNMENVFTSSQHTIQLLFIHYCMLSFFSFTSKNKFDGFSFRGGSKIK